MVGNFYPPCTEIILQGTRNSKKLYIALSETKLYPRLKTLKSSRNHVFFSLIMGGGGEEDLEGASNQLWPRDLTKVTSLNPVNSITNTKQKTDLNVLLISHLKYKTRF